MNESEIEFERIEIRYLESEIPSLLLPKLNRLKIITVGDVIRINRKEFLAMKGVGLNSFELLVSLQLDLVQNPSKYVDAYLAKREAEQTAILLKQVTESAKTSRLRKVIPTSLSGTENILDNLRLFDEAYKEHRTGSGEMAIRNYEVLRSLFGIGCAPRTMEECGFMHSITRERVRQIKVSEIELISKLLQGVKIRSSNVFCQERLVAQFHGLKQFVGNKCVVAYDQLLFFVNTPIDLEKIKSIMPYADLLMKVLGYDRTEYHGASIYYLSNRFLVSAIHELFATVSAVLRSSVFPQEETSIAKQVLLASCADVCYDDIATILREVPIYEPVHFENRDCFQLRFDRLPHAGAMAIRILYEMNHPMHYKELTEIVNQRVAVYGRDYACASDAMTAQLSVSGHAVPFGKRGLWALSRWGMNGSSIRVMIEDVLKANGSSLSYDQIYSALPDEHSDIKRRSVTKLIAIYKETFVRLKDGSVGLREWNYPNDALSPTYIAKPLVDDVEMMRMVVQCFSESGTCEMTRKDLRKRLENMGRTISSTTFYTRITKYPILEPVSGHRFLIRLRENHESIIQEAIVSWQRLSKTDRIRSATLRTLKRYGPKMRLLTLVEAVTAEVHCSPVTVYRVLRNEPAIEKEASGKVVTVSLKMEAVQ